LYKEVPTHHTDTFTPRQIEAHSHQRITYFYKGRNKVKGKAVPLQAWSGPEGSRKLGFPDFITTAQNGGKVSLMHRPPLPPGNTPGAHFCSEAETTSGP